jgi:hypothetical protein
MTLDVYLEIGTKRTFAGALEWPGWCRAARDEASALETLAAYAPRYAAVVKGSLPFRERDDPAELRVVERLQGNASTDFGAPGRIPASDEAPMSKADLVRAHAILRACWAAFDRTVGVARGRPLRKGPRGGGRDLERIIDHVLGADTSYVSQVGGKVDLAGSSGGEALRRVRTAALAGLDAAAKGLVPKQGPRGGRRWPPRYFTRRAAWHVLDHVWEIEDRLRAKT